MKSSTNIFACAIHNKFFSWYNKFIHSFIQFIHSSLQAYYRLSDRASRDSFRQVLYTETMNTPSGNFTFNWPNITLKPQNTHGDVYDDKSTATMRSYKQLFALYYTI